jgi:hypothetical protein
LVVSEDTGRLSVAAFGEIELDVTINRIEERLAKHFGRKRREGRPTALGAPELHTPSGAAARRKAGQP